MKKLLSLLLAAIMLLGMAGIAAADEINYDVTEPTKVVFWHTLNDDDDADLLQRIIKEFEAEHPLVTIEPVYYASYNKVTKPWPPPTWPMWTCLAAPSSTCPV